MPKFDLEELGFAPGAEDLFGRKSEAISQEATIVQQKPSQEYIDLEHPGVEEILLPRYCEAFLDGRAVEMPGGVYCNNRTCQNRERMSVTLPRHGRGYAPCSVEGILSETRQQV